MPYSKEFQAILDQPEVVPVFSSIEEERGYAKRITDEWQGISEDQEEDFEQLVSITKSLNKHAGYLNWPGRMGVYVILLNFTGDSSPRGINAALEDEELMKAAEILGGLFNYLSKTTSVETCVALGVALGRGTALPKELPADFDVYEALQRISEGQVGRVSKPKPAPKRSLSV